MRAHPVTDTAMTIQPASLNHVYATGIHPQLTMAPARIALADHLIRMPAAILNRIIALDWTGFIVAVTVTVG